MSPEQARGESLGPASDIFSLGLIFTHMLTGIAPMAGLPAIKIIDSLRRTDFIASLVGQIPITSRTAVADMLEMNPNHRPNAEDVACRMGSSSEH